MAQAPFASDHRTQSRRRWVVLSLVCAFVVSGVGIASPVPGAAVSAPAHVDPALADQLSLGPAPALLWFDDARASRSEVSAYLNANGIESHMFGGFSAALACASTADAIRTLALAPGALSVFGDHGLEPALDRSVPTAFNGDPDAVWNGLGVTGKGVGIAVVDTGVDGTHPDLEFGPRTKLNVRVLVSHRDLLGPNGDPCVQDMYTDQLQDSETTSGHGTHIASVAAGDGLASGGQYRGVAPEADIVGIGVADTVTPQVKLDQNNQISLLGAIGGMNYVLRNGLEGDIHVKVILAGWTQDELYDPWHPMAFAIRDMAAFGINVVFPAGNEGPEASDCSAAETCHFNPWAADADAIGVAATPHRSRTQLESYSSRGDPVPRQTRDKTTVYAPTLSAPGTGVVAARRPGLAPVVQPPGSILGGGPSDDPVLSVRYAGLTGTSVSAGHVAGAIALMQQAAARAKGCFLTTSQVQSILTSTATPMGGFAAWEVGAGALDVTAAVQAAEVAPLVPSVEPWMCP